VNLNFKAIYDFGHEKDTPSQLQPIGTLVKFRKWILE
jgi:hypothetical protein